MRARQIVGVKLRYPEGTILEMVAWELDVPVPGSSHRYKYRFFFGAPGRRLIGYDNERGKGDHRHYEGIEEGYHFESLEKAIVSFREDVERWRDANANTDYLRRTRSKEDD